MCFGKKKKKAKEEEAKRLAAQKEAEEAAKQEEANAAEEEEEETIVEETPTKTRKAIYRVVYDKEDKLWKIKKDGAKRVIDSKKTKEEALARVQELSQSQDSNFVVYKKDGKFQKKANLNLKPTDKGDNN